MPTNKNAATRYLAIDRCLSNPGRKFYIEDLVKACNDALLDLDNKSSGISKRTVYSDLNSIEDLYKTDIERLWDGQKKYFRYADKDFSITDQPINEQEKELLTEALQALSRFKGLPQFSWVEEIKVKLEQNFNLKTEENIISFDENPYLTGREFIGDLYNAIINKQALNIKYKPFKTENTTEFDIHPFHIKQYNNRWFLWGLNNEYNNLTNLALDRIQSISQSKIEYKPNTDIDFNEFFDDVIGVSINFSDKPQKVLLKVSSELFPYIRTKPLHWSQKVKEKNEHFTIIEITVQLNYELDALILSHGENIIVLEPKELIDSIQDKIEKMHNNY